MLEVDDFARAIRFGDDSTGGGEFSDERFDRSMIISDDGDLDRGGAKHGGGAEHGEAQEGGDAGKHTLIKVSRPMPTRLSDSLNYNPTPLRCTFGMIFRPRP